MPVELPARGVRIGGVTVAPGEARAVVIPLAASRTAKGGDRGVPAWVVVGRKPGPRVGVVAALRAGEITAARAARRLAEDLEPDGMAGSVVVVPVLRPRGRLASAARSARLSFPGQASGDRASRDAFALFSDVVIGAQALIILAGPRRGRRGPVVARGRLADPRVRRLALQSGARVILAATPRPGELLAAATAAHVIGLELVAAEGGTAEGETAEGETAEGETVDRPVVSTVHSLAQAARASLAALGVLPTPPGPSPAIPLPAVAARTLRVRAPADGFLEPSVVPGGAVRARAVLGRLSPLLPGVAAPLVTPADGMVIEVAPPGPVRAGAALFSIVPMSWAAARRREAVRRMPGATGGRPEGDGKTRVGWVEHVSLPGLDVQRLKAKIDTGARTSALHVTRMRTVDTDGGPHRRPILEIAVPGGGRGRRPRLVRAVVRRFVVVRDTSGRTERRPVIETALKLGPIERRIAVTLTNRGDMLFPMLVGRTALGPGVVVDPSRPYLFG